MCVGEQCGAHEHGAAATPTRPWIDPTPSSRRLFVGRLRGMAQRPCRRRSNGCAERRSSPGIPKTTTRRGMSRIARTDENARERLAPRPNSPGGHARRRAENPQAFHARHRLTRELVPGEHKPGSGRARWGQSFVHRCQREEQNLLFCRDSRADDGTRTHDLLHGKSP